jgi:hypothetical protein
LLARSAKYFPGAQFKARNTLFERLGILFPEKEVNSEVTPVKYKTGKTKRVARVCRELRTMGKLFLKIKFRAKCLTRGTTYVERNMLVTGRHCAQDASWG